MQDFGTKADNSPPPGGQLSAAEFNNLATENENAVLRSGQTLSGASDTQMATSLFLHGVKSGTFQDSGAANAYVATPVSGSSGVLLPTGYTSMDGAVIIFKASNGNTAASTLNIGQTTGTLIGTKAIVDQTGAAISSGAITGGAYVMVRFDASIGAGSWVLIQDGGLAPSGQGRLTFVSATSIKFSPYNGNGISINGVLHRVPSAGITASNGSLAANTTYFVYAFISGGVVTLGFSVTGHATHTNGVEIMSGDPLSTLVGMIRTNASSQFVDSSSTRFCLSWFNRQDVAAWNVLSANRSTTSATPVEITTAAERAQFLSWGGESVFASVSGVASQNTAGSFSTLVSIDGSTAGSICTISPPSGQASSVCPSNPWVLAEGFHYAAILGTATPGFTATWPAGTNSVAIQTKG